MISKCDYCRDLETITVPILQQLYRSNHKAPSQLYMLLIIVLILSEDSAFAQNLHQITVPSVPWFKERLLQKTSLGTCPLPCCLMGVNCSQSPQCRCMKLLQSFGSNCSLQQVQSGVMAVTDSMLPPLALTPLAFLHI